MARPPVQLSRNQLMALWNQAGGNPQAAGTAASIALAESGGRVNALNERAPDYSVGPWQINYYGNLRGPRTRQFGTPQQLRSDPLANARAAVAISGGGRNFSPWSTYTSGAYKRAAGQGGAPMAQGIQNYAQGMMGGTFTVTPSSPQYENASSLRQLDHSPIEAASRQAHSQFAMSLINQNSPNKPQSVEGMMGAIMQLRSSMRQRSVVADEWSGHSDAAAAVSPPTITFTPDATGYGAPNVPQTTQQNAGINLKSAGFNKNLAALQKAVGNLGITSGYRSMAEQTKLWNDALKKYGSPDAARKWVAPPGHSNHNKGLAADLHGDLQKAHQLASQFGLTFPMPWEPWHVEPIGLRG